MQLDNAGQLPSAIVDMTEMPQVSGRFPLDSHNGPKSYSHLLSATRHHQ